MGTGGLKNKSNMVGEKYFPKKILKFKYKGDILSI
jgi:hypothetical protein